MLDAGQFKVAFESAQDNNAELLGLTAPSRERKNETEESESKSESKPEEKTEEQTQDKGE